MPSVERRGRVGPVVAFRAWLGSVDAGGLSDAERVDLVAELERVKGSASAVQARATDALRCSREAVAPRDVARSVGSQVALARRESPGLGDRFVGLSRALVHEMPATMAALAAGVIGERHAVAVVQATAALSRADRAEVDRRVGPVLGRLGVTGRRPGGGAGRGRAGRGLGGGPDGGRGRSRRVTVRPAPDGMAYLSVLGPLREVVGAHAALLARSRAVVAGQCPDEAPDGRGAGAVAADTALRLLSGRAVGEVQPVEVHLVMTDRALLGTGDPAGRCSSRPASPATAPSRPRSPAPGCARASTRLDATDRGGATPASVWLRRLYTSPGGRDLVAMDSRRRVFGGLLRRMLVLRDDVCATPWCEAPIVHADHTTAVREGGAAPRGATATALCARCNQVKEAPGWRVTVIHPGTGTESHSIGQRRATGANGAPRKQRPATSGRPRRRDRRQPRHRPREIEVRTPTGHRYRSQAPPLTGWGWQHHPPTQDDPARHPDSNDTCSTCSQQR